MESEIIYYFPIPKIDETIEQSNIIKRRKAKTKKVKPKN